MSLDLTTAKQMELNLEYYDPRKHGGRTLEELIEFNRIMDQNELLMAGVDSSSIDSLAEVVTKDTNPKTIYGQAKPSIALVPGPAVIHIANAFADGATKYGPANWRDDPVSTSTYINAALRHLLSYYDGERDAADSGVHHLAHAAACLCIILDAEEQGTLVDDRPTAGRSATVIKRLTKKINVT